MDHRTWCWTSFLDVLVCFNHRYKIGNSGSNSNSNNNSNNNNHNDNNGSSATSSAVKWNESNLAKNEEEKVPHMKIDEPPTPYEKNAVDSIGCLTGAHITVVDRVKKDGGGSSIFI